MCLRQWDDVDEPFISGCNRPGFSEAEVEIIWDGRYLISIDADGLAQKVLWHKQPTQMASAGQTRFPLTFYSWGKPWKSDLEGVCRPQCCSERGFLPPSVICLVLFRKGIIDLLSSVMLQREAPGEMGILSSSLPTFTPNYVKECVPLSGRAGEMAQSGKRLPWKQA